MSEDTVTERVKRVSASPVGREDIRPASSPPKRLVQKVRAGGAPRQATPQDIEKLNRVAPAIQKMLADTSLLLGGVTRLRIELHDEETVVAALTASGQIIFHV